MDLLDKLESEKKQKHLEFKIENNLKVSNLGEIIDGYKKSLKLDEVNSFYYYGFLVKTCSPDDIEAFSKMIYTYQDHKNFDYLTGHFLSGLINKCYNDSVTLDLTNCETPINYIGYCTTKSINVKGNVGKYLGVHMRTGKIVVNGNASDWVGEAMQNGEIELNGNCCEGIGNWMEDGTIRINGDYKSLGEFCCKKKRQIFISNPCGNGNIYHKDKSIMENGIVIGPIRQKIREWWHYLQR